MTITETRPVRPSDVRDVLAGLFFFPPRLRALQSEITPRAFRFIAGWLSSTALWLPAGLALLPILTGRITAENAPASAYLISGMALLWVLTGLAGNIAYDTFRGALVSILSLLVGAILIGAGMFGLVSIMIALSITGEQLAHTVFAAGLVLSLGAGIGIAAALDNEISAAMVLIITALSIGLKATLLTLILAAISGTILLKAPDSWWGRPLRWGILTLWIGGLALILLAGLTGG